MNARPLRTVVTRDDQRTIWTVFDDRRRLEAQANLLENEAAPVLDITNGV